MFNSNTEIHVHSWQHKNRDGEQIVTFVGLDEKELRTVSGVTESKFFRNHWDKMLEDPHFDGVMDEFDALSHVNQAPLLVRLSEGDASAFLELVDILIDCYGDLDQTDFGDWKLSKVSYYADKVLGAPVDIGNKSITSGHVHEPSIVVIDGSLRHARTKSPVNLTDFVDGTRVHVISHLSLKNLAAGEYRWRTLRSIG